jgi:hypothetical protein
MRVLGDNLCTLNFSWGKYSLGSARGQTALRGQAVQAVNREVLLPGLGDH